MIAARNSLARVLAIARNTFAEAIRMRLFLLLAFVALGSLAGGFVFRDFNLGASELRFIADFGFGGMTLFGSIIAVVVTAQLLYGEFEQRTVMTLLSKPVSRGEFLAGKLLGVWATVLCFVAVLAATLLLALWARETQLVAELGEPIRGDRRVPYSGVLLFAVLQVARLAIISSAVAFFCSYATSSMFAIIMGVFFWILGQAQAMAAGQLEQVSSWWGRAVLWLFTVAVPNLRSFDIGATLLQGKIPTPGELALLGVYAVLYTLLYASFATLILRKREL